ncbi:MAG TPA: AbrB/MazE/SpoVT family DNA-binding domain-containing protein [Acidiferrobacteraceae bacterium]|nr:AbrB/MazE/SpoVT family DNA-binding domain-containing protein [Acidiferrobacteraceae bacterium]
MAHLVKIGNSQGIRIPKPLVEQAHLEGKELKLQVVKNGILVVPERGVREGWKGSIEKLIGVHGHEPIDEEWLDPPLVSDDDLDW